MYKKSESQTSYYSRVMGRSCCVSSLRFKDLLHDFSADSSAVLHSLHKKCKCTTSLSFDAARETGRPLLDKINHKSASLQVCKQKCQVS